MGRVASYPLPPRGSLTLESGGQIQKWPTVGPGSYINPTTWGVPNASKRGTKLEVAHKWARWLHNPCRLGGSPPLQGGGRNQKWPTSGPGGYITPAAGGGPQRFKAGDKISSGSHKWRKLIFGKFSN